MAKFLFASLALLCVIPQGFGIRCYTYTCSKSFGGPQTPCSPVATDCASHSNNIPITADRCSKFSLAMTQTVGSTTMHMTQEVGTCAYSSMCSPAMQKLMCKSATSGNPPGVTINNCKVQCCQGDLCNHNSMVPVTHGPPAPSGAALSCYSCETGKASCANPVVQTCGTDPIIGISQDRCSTSVVTYKFGSQEITHKQKKCATSAVCQQDICKLIHDNSSGMTVKQCHFNCCAGKLCNTGNIGA